nr:helix-turn-helix domain-containing protein [Nocardiopsis ganjiahuensis]
MTQPEVAALFRVSSHTVSRWIRKGALSPFRTLGGHKRFHTSEILALAGLNHNR